MEGVPLYLIDIVVEGWGVDRPSVEEQDPKCANNRKGQRSCVVLHAFDTKDRGARFIAECLSWLLPVPMKSDPRLGSIAGHGVLLIAEQLGC